MRLIDADKIEVGHIVHDMGGLAFLDDVQEYLDKQPTVDAEPVRHAQWEDITLAGSGCASMYRCSLCRRVETSYRNLSRFTHSTPYCHCGAKMDENEE